MDVLRRAHVQVAPPFVTALFDRETIDRFVAAKGLEGDFPYVNDWPIERFRERFERYQGKMERRFYRETKDRFQFSFLRRFMPHLRRALSLDSLLADHVEGLLRNR